MKNIKEIPLFAAFLFAGLVIKAQDKSPEEIKKLIESQNYIFKAEQVFPQSGKSRMLTTDYDLSITIDSIISFLPYFGRSYTASLNPEESGIKFTSTDFEYQNTKKKKSWEISIKPKDVSDIQEISLSIFDNGTANLNVSSTNRQNISFRGYIKEGKGNKKKAF